jgi:hypothetical protein
LPPSRGNPPTCRLRQTAAAKISRGGREQGIHATIKYTVESWEAGQRWSSDDFGTRQKAETEAEQMGMTGVGPGSVEDGDKAKLIVEGGEHGLEVWVYEEGACLYDECDPFDEDNPHDHPTSPEYWPVDEGAPRRTERFH